MIAISDIILLTVSSAVLAVALVRSNGGNSAAQDPAPQVPAASVSQISSQSTTQPDSSTEASNGNTGSTTTDVKTTEITATVVNPIVIEAESDPAAQSSQEYITYTVQSGDSLSKIATQFGTSVSELQSINDLSNTRILVGQELLYPKP